MDAASAKELAAAMAVLASLVDKLGAGGVLGLMVGSPLLMVVTFSLQGWWSARRQQSLLESYQKDALLRAAEMDKLAADDRKYIFELWEHHRGETQKALDQLKESQNKLGRYYENNVILVQNYEQMSKVLNELVALTSRNIERLSVKLETFIDMQMGSKK